MNPTKEVTTCRPATSHAWDDLIRRMDAEMEKIRNRAFRLFELRGPNEATELDDWLQAERELFAEYPVETKDTENDVTVTLGVPGFEAKDLTVTVLPESMVVEGKMTKTEKETTERREFLRHIPLPCVIRTEGVKAVLDEGRLTVTALKTPPVKVETTEKKAVAAASA